VSESTSARRPPLWLAAAGVASAWGVVYSIGRWTLLFVAFPIHSDFPVFYVAAEAGVRYGWSTIYNLTTLRSLSTGFPTGELQFDSTARYVNPPLLAWLLAPLTIASEPAAYVIWTAVSLAALVGAWHLAAPYHGFAKVTLLLAALALWPVLLSFSFGQPAIVILALLATAWWLCAHDHPVSAGLAVAAATFLKPQLVTLMPLALLASGHYRAVGGWILGCAVLGLASVASLGQTGLVDWWQALRFEQAAPTNVYYTLVQLFGFSPATYALWIIQGVAVMLIAWRRRAQLEIVFAAGLVGSLAVASYLHQSDFSVLVLAGWLVLRTSPPFWHRLWLLAGVATLQVLALALPFPQLLWDASWLAILAVSSFSESGVSVPATPPGAGLGARAGT